jgi:hypothetical protein
VVSLVDNIKQGNVISAVIDGAGVLVDTAGAKRALGARNQR